LFFQIDKSGDGFVFSQIDKGVLNGLKASLKSINDERNAEFDIIVENSITPSEPITASDVAFADVPFYQGVGNDRITLGNNDIIAIGDFASFGEVFSQTGGVGNLPSPLYAESIKILRMKPSVASFLYMLR
jgi:hypothetical protein